jgi:hypothetical protein
MSREDRDAWARPLPAQRPPQLPLASFLAGQAFYFTGGAFFGAILVLIVRSIIRGGI